MCDEEEDYTLRYTMEAHDWVTRNMEGVEQGSEPTFVGELSEVNDLLDLLMPEWRQYVEKPPESLGITIEWLPRTKRWRFVCSVHGDNGARFMNVDDCSLITKAHVEKEHHRT